MSPLKFSGQVALFSNLLLELNQRNGLVSEIVLDYVNTSYLSSNFKAENNTAQSNWVLNFIVNLVARGCVPMMKLLKKCVEPVLIRFNTETEVM